MEHETNISGPRFFHLPSGEVIREDQITGVRSIDESVTESTTYPPGVSIDLLQGRYTIVKHETVEERDQFLAAFTALLPNIVNIPTEQGLATQEEETKTKEELQAVVAWLWDFMGDASDGGEAWCAVRDRPGASKWFKRMEAVMTKVEERKNEENTTHTAKSC